MKFVSDNGKVYENDKTCLEADKKYAEELAKQKADFEKKQKAKIELEKQRKERADEVQNAYQIYVDKLNAFIKDFGTYHTRFTSSDMPPVFRLNELFKLMGDF